MSGVYVGTNTTAETASIFDQRVMESVQTRGSGWVSRLPIVNFRFPIGVWLIGQSAIEKRQWFDSPATATWC